MGNKIGKGGGLKNSPPKFRQESIDGDGKAKNIEVGTKLKSVPLLASYSDDERAALGAVLEFKTFAAGDNLVKQGDPGEGFFIIDKGECVVNRELADGKTIEIGRLKDGDYFGELALLNNKARGATVTATSDICAFYLLRSHFQELFHPDALNVKFAKRAAVSAVAHA